MEKKDEILRTALEIVSTEGIDSLTINTLASRVGLSKATMYNYFKSKEEIITESYKNGYTKGFTSNYILVHIKGKYDTNKIIKVKIDKVVDKNTVIAKLV